MGSMAMAALFAVFLWWLGTGLVFFAASLPRAWMRSSFAVATLALLIAVHALYTSAPREDALGALLAFAAAIVIWGWCELTFLFGLITGPNRDACPADADHGERFRLAMRALLYHELCLLLAGGTIWFLTREAAVPVAFLTFALLWGLRVSAKLNLFLGTPNFSEEMTPESMRYLGSYFGKARFNPLMPVALLLAGALAWLFGAEALAAASELERTGYTLLSTLMLLGVFEHLMMTIPLRDTALWDVFAPRKPVRKRAGETP